ANQIGDDPNRGGLSRRWVMQAADESLRRLGTDHIDIYYLHKEDHATPLQETVRAMGDLIRQGKIRYFGVSNYRAWRVAEICNICDDNGIDRPVVSQPYYNAMNRMPEVEHFPACRYSGLRHRRDRRPPHRGTVGRLHPRTGLSLHGGGRGTDRSPRGEWASLHPGVQRSGLSDRRTAGADGLTVPPKPRNRPYKRPKKALS